MQSETRYGAPAPGVPAVALITGAGRGIGAATALALAREGWSLLLSWHRDAAACEAVAEQARALGVRAEVRRCDVAVDAEVEALFAHCDAVLGAPGAVVANAGIVDVVARVDAIDRPRLERMFATNVFGAFACAREAVRRMSTRHGGAGGTVVLLSSAAARLGAPGEYVDYAAAKAAVDALAIGLGKEVAAEGVRVVGVRPGLIDTEIHASGGRPDRLRTLAPAVPMQRGGTAAEVAETIAWLVCARASYVTATLVDVTGGR